MIEEEGEGRGRVRKEISYDMRGESRRNEKKDQGEEKRREEMRRGER